VLIILFRSIEDEDGPAVAREFYAALLPVAKEVIDADAVNVSYALDEAVSKLRRQDVSPTRWVSFIHVGHEALGSKIACLGNTPTPHNLSQSTAVTKRKEQWCDSINSIHEIMIQPELGYGRGRLTRQRVDG
jgi:hypothetical protein